MTRLLRDPSLGGLPLVVIDFEGLTPTGRPAEPTEVAALALRPEHGRLVEVGRFEYLIRPPATGRCRTSPSPPGCWSACSPTGVPPGGGTPCSTWMLPPVALESLRTAGPIRRDHRPEVRPACRLRRGPLGEGAQHVLAWLAVTNGM
ncbi:hypothetical protein [Kitasatospora griseola]